MKIVTSNNPNFHIKESGVRVSLENGSIIEFYKGDGIRISSSKGTPFLEFKANNTSYKVKLSKENLSALLSRVYHPKEFQVKQVELLDAMTDDNLSTESIVEAFAEIADEQSNKSRKHLKIPTRVSKYSLEEKVKEILISEILLTESKDIVIIESNASEISDAKYDEADDDNMDDEKDDDDKDMDDTDEDEDEKDKDEMEGKKKKK